MSDDFDFNAAADRLFGGAKPAVEPVAAVQPEPTIAAESAQTVTEAAPADPRELRRQAEDIERERFRQRATSDADKALQDKYPGVPLDIARLRDTPERRMFGAQGTFSTVQVQGDVPIDVVQAASAELREIFADVGASGTDAAEILTIAQQMATVPATPEARAELRSSTIDAVNRQYGNDAAAAVADARALVARDPRIGKMLDSTGLGDHPGAVLKIISLARSAKLRGQL